jgi:hypothetical protein
MSSDASSSGITWQYETYIVIGIDKDHFRFYNEGKACAIEVQAFSFEDAERIAAYKLFSPIALCRLQIAE